MSLEDMIPQARQSEGQRRPFSRGNITSPTNEFSSYHHDQIPSDRSGLSLKTLFSRTMSFRSSTTATSSGFSALFRESSVQLSMPEQDATRSSSLMTDDWRVTTSCTMESGWSSISRTSWDPPPLFQAYPQALRYALLDSPSASTESILRRQTPAISAGSTTPTNLEEATLSHKKTKKHKRRTSPSVASGWKRKLYVLVTNGYVLQYAADGHHDRLPEKILQLRYNSVAFASDAISGRPYVLQISRDPDQCDEQIDTNAKSIWSRVGFRTVEEKRMAASFLLVCESADELDAWMIAVRREIEAHGGAQCRCNTPRAEHDQSTTVYELSEQSQSSQNMHEVPESLPSRPADSHKLPETIEKRYEPLPEIKTLSGFWSDQAFFRRRSSADSSVNTATELDDLRESSQCSSSTATGHRLSLDESHSSLSPAEDKFRETYTALTGSTRKSGPHRKSPPLQDTVNDLPRRNSLSPKQPPIAHPEKRRLSFCDAESRPVSDVPNFSLPNLSHRYSRCSVMLSDTSSLALSEILDIVDPEQSFKTGPADNTVPKRPTSIIAPLPSRETLVRKPRSRVSSVEHTRRRTSSGSLKPASNPSPKGQQDSAENKATFPNTASAYSLFPKRHSTSDAQKTSFASSLTQNDLPEHSVGTSHSRSFSTPRLDEPDNSLRVPASRRMRRPASMQINLKRSLDIEKPERSPAVTDLHFATNFGTANPFNRSSCIFAQKSTSSGSQLKIVSPSIQGRTRSARRTAASGSIIGPPAGPPPTCPLPEPPSIYIRGSSVPAGLSSPRRIFLDLTTDD